MKECVASLCMTHKCGLVVFDDDDDDDDHDDDDHDYDYNYNDVHRFIIDISTVTNLILVILKDTLNRCS